MPAMCWKWASWPKPSRNPCVEPATVVTWPKEKASGYLLLPRKRFTGKCCARNINHERIFMLILLQCVRKKRIKQKKSSNHFRFDAIFLYYKSHNYQKGRERVQMSYNKSLILMIWLIPLFLFVKLNRWNT